MTDIIRIENQNGILFASSRLVSEHFNKRHADIITKIEGKNRDDGRKEVGLIEEIGSTGNPVHLYFIKNEYINEQNNQAYTEYLMTREGFSLLVMGFTGKKALEWKLKYIDAFNKMEDAIKNQNSKTLPKTYKEALLQLVDQIDISEKLIEENKTLHPKAEYFDQLVDKNLLTNFRDTAKELKVKEKKFIQCLLEHKYLYRDKKGKLKPYAENNNGLFEVKEGINEKTGWKGVQTLITPKGRDTFRMMCSGM